MEGIAPPPPPRSARSDPHRFLLRHRFFFPSSPMLDARTSMTSLPTRFLSYSTRSLFHAVQHGNRRQGLRVLPEVTCDVSPLETKCRHVMADSVVTSGHSSLQDTSIFVPTTICSSQGSHNVKGRVTWIRLPSPVVTWADTAAAAATNTALAARTRSLGELQPPKEKCKFGALTNVTVLRES